MPAMHVNGVSLFVKVVGRGSPLLLMHGGPGADLWSLWQFRELADRFTLVFYDHRCNGRSAGAPLSSMTWENLAADAEAIRQELGYGPWAVLGHSFGGYVALEYALRYPDSLSHLVLLDAGGDSWWGQVNASRLLAQRGFKPETVKLAQRFLNGRIEPNEFLPALLRLGKAYDPYMSIGRFAVDLLHGEWQSKPRPEALIYAAPNLIRGWSVMDRLGEIRVPTLVIAGRDDFIFPPEHQAELAAAIPDAKLRLIDRAGHNPHAEQTEQVMTAVAAFLADPRARAPVSPVAVAAGGGR